MDAVGDYHALAAMLLWQHDLGATEAIGDAPVNRYAQPDAVAQAARPPAAPPQAAEPRALAPAPVPGDAVAVSQAAAARAGTLDDLRAAMAAYDHCEIKRGARNLVFADGNPAARVMVIGEAPGRDEDTEGRPFVGRAGQLLDRMFAAIGLTRTSPDPAAALYITNVMPWRPPQNRDPSADEIAMMQPFLRRHVELADPQVIVLMGNTPCQAVLGRSGITRMRGDWAQVWGRPVLPMFHPAYLLRQPHLKREAWADLLALHARLQGT
ncbi:uracil-DNA glycosylase [Paracoccaceae bacterium Fryx2]|nr:uracil-DNA glycosylase [Paracoccaceae bacterium Fryx2]